MLSIDFLIKKNLHETVVNWSVQLKKSRSDSERNLQSFNL